MMSCSYRFFGPLAVLLVVGCGGPCAELEKKKSECTGDGKEVCEKLVEDTAKAGDANACQAALDKIAKKQGK